MAITINDDDFDSCFDDYVNATPGCFDDDARQVYGNNVLSDIHCKMLKDLANKQDALTPEEISFIKDMAGPMTISEQEDVDWDENMLDAYARHLRNYLYTYKEEATKVDPRIDPSEEHVGPMAQDIEKVAPDCVKETPEGIKTVDGNRLALVNAGVIGDITRKLDALEAKINAK